MTVRRKTFGIWAWKPSTKWLQERGRQAKILLKFISFLVLQRSDLIIVHLQKDSCSRGAINKRTRAGLQEKVNQSFAFPPCLLLSRHFGEALLFGMIARFALKSKFLERAARCLRDRKPHSSPYTTVVLKFGDLTKFLDVNVFSIVMNTQAITKARWGTKAGQRFP